MQSVKSRTNKVIPLEVMFPWPDENSEEARKRYEDSKKKKKG